MLRYFEPGFWGHFLIFPSKMLYLVKRYCCIVPWGVGREGMAGDEQSTEQRGNMDWTRPGLSPSQLVGTLSEGNAAT